MSTKPVLEEILHTQIEMLAECNALLLATIKKGVMSTDHAKCNTLRENARIINELVKTVARMQGVLSERRR